jgi:hypothetical protein
MQKKGSPSADSNHGPLPVERERNPKKDSQSADDSNHEPPRHYEVFEENESKKRKA